MSFSEIGNNIKYIRSTKGLSQKKLSELMGINYRHLQEIESGKSDVKFSTLQKFGAFFGLTPAEILENRYFILNKLTESQIDKFPYIVIETNVYKEMVYSNKAGKDFYGENHLGNFPHDYFCGNQKTYKTVEPIYQGINCPIYVESRQRRSDNSERTLAWWCKTIFHPDQTIKGALSYAIDISDYRITWKP